MSSTSLISYIAAPVEITKRFGRFAFSQYEQFPAVSQRILRKIWEEDHDGGAHVFEIELTRRDGEIWMGLVIRGVGQLWKLRIDAETAQMLTLGLAKLFGEIEDDACEARARSGQAFAVLKTLDRGALESSVRLAADDDER